MKKVVLPLVISASLLASCGSQINTQTQNPISGYTLDLNTDILNSEARQKLTTEENVTIKFKNGYTLDYYNYNGNAYIDGDMGIGPSIDIPNQVEKYDSILKNGDLSSQSAGVVLTYCDIKFLGTCIKGRKDERWNDGVPYTYGPELNDVQRGIINDAIYQWNSRVEKPKFFKTTATSTIVTFNTGILPPKVCGNTSHLGRWSGQNTIVILKPNFELPEAECGMNYKNMGRQPTIAMVMHEMGHVAGLIHEHQRKDRDSYVLTNYILLEKGQGDTGIDIWDYRTTTAYDYSSIMHYIPAAPNPDNSKDKYLALNPNYSSKPYLGNPNNFGFYNNPYINDNDVLGIKALYSYEP